MPFESRSSAIGADTTTVVELDPELRAYEGRHPRKSAGACRSIVDERSYPENAALGVLIGKGGEQSPGRLI
jgi:hypothetical protein